MSEYHLSTKGRTLEEVGFIHCSFAHQVDGIEEDSTTSCPEDYHLLQQLPTPCIE